MLRERLAIPTAAWFWLFGLSAATAMVLDLLIARF